MGHPFYERLSFKFFLCILFALLLPAGAVFLLTNLYYRELMKGEIHARTEETLIYCEKSVEDVFLRMIAVSNIINDHAFVQCLKAPQTSYYERCVQFDRMVDTLDLLAVQGAGLREVMEIALIDVRGDVYSSADALPDAAQTPRWGQTEPVVWRFVGEAGAQRRFVLSRVLYNNNSLDDPVGVLTVTVAEAYLIPVLEEYVDLAQDCIVLYLSGGEYLTGFYNGPASPRALFDAFWARYGAARPAGELQKLGAQRYLVNSYAVNEALRFNGEKLRVLILTDYAGVFGEADAQAVAVLWLLCAVLLAMLLLSAFLTRRLVRPIRRLDAAMRGFRVGEEPAAQPRMPRDEVGGLYASYREMARSINTLFRNLQREHAVRENYRYESLRAQLNPHFLFNSLNAIKLSAKMIHADGIADSIDTLAHMLRYSMAKGENLVPLSAELENIQNYLKIHNNRFGNHVALELDESVNAFLEHKVLKFFLQPVVENSIAHGFQGYTDNGILLISCRAGEGCLSIVVQDNGKGFSPQALAEWAAAPRAGERHSFNGLGLAAIDQIIKVTYGDAYGLQIESTPYEGTSVTYRLPLEQESEGTDGNAHHDRG